MAEANNFVLFKRDSKESQEDIWDDTALIEAYDRAVNLVKEKISAKLGLNDDENTAESLSNGSSKDASKTKSPSKKEHGWKVGDYVRSIYSEDNIVYEAIIEKIMPTSSSCLIRYLGYDNQEEKLLKDLEPSGGPSARRQQILDSAEGDNSNDDMECETPTQHSTSKTLPCAAGIQWQPVKTNIQPHPPETGFPAMPPSSFSIPPPPPPAAWPSSTSDLDSDSLYSMLMSWYMAGYHTGYYQGTRQKGHGSGGK